MVHIQLLSTPGEIRTHDSTVKSRLLWARLSYRGLVGGY